MLLYLLTEWSVNSSGHGEGATITVFTDYVKALKAYGKRYVDKNCPCGGKVTVEQTETRTVRTCECDQNYVSETTVDQSGLYNLSDFEDGSWKRPGGKQLRVVHEGDEDGVWTTRVQTYPENRTYY